MEQFLLRAKVEEWEYLEGRYVSSWVEGYLNLVGITEDGPKFTFVEPIKGECVSHHHWKDNEHYVYRPVEHSLFSKETISRWTGLLDKKGKKVWEGDIIKWETFGDDFMYLVVIYEPGKFIVRPCDPEIRHNSVKLCGEQTYSEVIGNRWDNPELLEADPDVPK